MELIGVRHSSHWFGFTLLLWSGSICSVCALTPIQTTTAKPSLSDDFVRCANEQGNITAWCWLPASSSEFAAASAVRAASAGGWGCFRVGCAHLVIAAECCAEVLLHSSSLPTGTLQTVFEHFFADPMRRKNVSTARCILEDSHLHG